MTGKLFALGEEAPYRHERVYAREDAGGTDRVRAGGADGPVALVVDLATTLVEPLFVLGVVRVGRTGASARHESEALTRAEAAAFCAEHAELFENDGRAELWVGETAGPGLLVLDEHDLVYGYGPVEAMEAALCRRGWVPGDPVAPEPHEHRYHPELDAAEDRLRAWPRWRRVLPLDDE